MSARAMVPCHLPNGLCLGGRQDATRGELYRWNSPQHPVGTTTPRSSTRPLLFQDALRSGGTTIEVHEQRPHQPRGHLLDRWLATTPLSPPHIITPTLRRHCDAPHEPGLTNLGPEGSQAEWLPTTTNLGPCDEAAASSPAVTPSYPGHTAANSEGHRP